MRRRQDYLSGQYYNFLCGFDMGLIPRPHASIWAWPHPCRRHKRWTL